MHITLDKLKNNLKVIYVPQESMFSVTIMVLVKVGSRYEKKQENGLAHFVEHMFFKGTEKRSSSKAIGMAIEQIGGTSNAFTSFDYTGYFIKIPKENLIEAISILSDLIKNGLFKEEEIMKERGVIKEEIRMYEDNPIKKTYSEWFSRFFEDTPLGRDITGTVDSVEQINRKDFLNFVDKYYKGENMLFIVSGGFEKQAVQEQITKHFEEIPKGKSYSYKHHERKKRKSELVNISKSLEQSHLVLGGYSFEREYEGKYVLQVAEAMLSKGFGSRLFQVIRDELGLAYYVYSKNENFEETGVFLIGLGVQNSKIESAVEAVIKEVNDIINGNFETNELERAKNFLLGGLVTDMEETDDFAIWYGLQELLEGKYDTLEEVKKEIFNVTRDQIVEQMQKIYKDQELLLVSLTPHKNLDENIEKLLNI